MDRLNGITAVVTGAGAGIGEQICLRFAREGATVVALDRDGASAEAVVRRIGEDGGAAHAHQCDISSNADCGKALEWVKRELGGVHALCNVAGIVDSGTLLDADEESWRRTMEINLTGAYYMCRLFVPLMIASGGGSIVNIASIGGLVGFAGSVGYQASKGGVIQMTRTLAVEWAPAGVRVNAIAPGHIATTLVMKQWETEPELKEFFLDRTPMGRLGKPDDVVGAVVFLASDAASMVTGQTLAIDGGYTAQ